MVLILILRLALILPQHDFTECAAQDAGITPHTQVAAPHIYVDLAVRRFAFTILTVQGVFGFQ